jgi:hypothetical protein
MKTLESTPREWLEHPAEETARKTQSFFAELADQVKRPGYGAQAADGIREVLLRARERGLYVP